MRIEDYFVDPTPAARVPAPADHKDHPTPWGAVPEHLRLDWCRALLDFPPSFPNVGWLVRVAATIRSDRVATLHEWAWQAAAFHRIGFTPGDWYLLRLCVDRRRDDLLGREDGRFVIDTIRAGYPSLALVADDWADWLPLIRSGLTPKRALDLLVDGDRRSWPGGSVYRGDGSIETTA